jgi:hypothetical protein
MSCLDSDAVNRAFDFMEDTVECTSGKDMVARDKANL